MGDYSATKNGSQIKDIIEFPVILSGPSIYLFNFMSAHKLFSTVGFFMCLPVSLKKRPIIKIVL